MTENKLNPLSCVAYHYANGDEALVLQAVNRGLLPPLSNNGNCLGFEKDALADLDVELILDQVRREQTSRIVSGSMEGFADQVVGRIRERGDSLKISDPQDTGLVTIDQVCRHYGLSFVELNTLVQRAILPRPIVNAADSAVGWEPEIFALHENALRAAIGTDDEDEKETPGSSNEDEDEETRSRCLGQLAALSSA